MTIYYGYYYYYSLQIMGNKDRLQFIIFIYVILVFNFKFIKQTLFIIFVYLSIGTIYKNKLIIFC